MGRPATHVVPVRRTRNTSPRRRLGVILPMALVVLTAVTVVTVSMLAVTARQVRATRNRWDTQQAISIADAALASAVAEWNPSAVAATPIGERRDTMWYAPDGWLTHLRFLRTAPLIAVVDASVQRLRGGASSSSGETPDPWTVRRRVSRVVWLQPPVVPLPAAVTVLGAIALAGAEIDGREQSVSPREPGDDCGGQRDTASRTALATGTLAGIGAGIVGTVQTLSSSQMAMGWTQLQVAQPLLLARLHPTPMGVDGPVDGVAPWVGRRIDATGGTTLRGQLYRQGVLLVNGDLELTGTLHLDGLLVVLGRLDATQGRLLVHGQLLIADPTGRVSSLGQGTSVRYAPCLVGRALAAISRPRPAPFFSWNTP